MNKAMKVALLIPALLFVLLGIGWLLVPARVAAEFGMPLLDGLGGSTQIGDLGAFFMAGGLIVIFGLVTEKREWFYAATLLVAGAAFFRTASWLLHGMPFAGPQIAVEVTLTVLLFGRGFAVDISLSAVLKIPAFMPFQSKIAQHRRIESTVYG